MNFSGITCMHVAGAMEMQLLIIYSNQVLLSVISHVQVLYIS